MPHTICNGCITQADCSGMCAALERLHHLADTQDTKDKTARLRALARQLGVRDAEPSRQLKRLAGQLIRKLPELSYIQEWGIKVGYVESSEKKSGERIVFADCRKVQEVFRAYLPFDFIITFYIRNTGMLNESQLKILMLHELQHIEMGERGLKIRAHDVEDFKSILAKYGLDWNEPGKELPDLLGGE